MERVYKTGAIGYGFSMLNWAGLALVVLLSGDLVAAPTFSKGSPLAVIPDFGLNEASGLMASRQNPGVIWTHNDSSYPGVLFALSTNGTLLGLYSMSFGYAGDYEDMALGPGPEP